MTDLSAMARQAQQRQVAMPVPPNLNAPSAVAVEPIPTPDGGHVAMTVFNQHGVFVVGMSGRSAIEIGKKITAAGRAAISGLTVVGDVGGTE